MPEAAIAQALSAAGVRLRGDRVVQRLAEQLGEQAARSVPAGSTVLITLTAPIRQPGRTCEALARWIAEPSASSDRCESLYGNAARLRWVATPGDTPRVRLFVHNSPADAVRILDLAAACLRKGLAA